MKVIVQAVPQSSADKISTKGIDNQESFTSTLQPIDKEDSNSEIEKAETVLLPDLMGFYKAGGKTHKRGGTPVNLDPGTFIFSNDKSLVFSESAKKTLELPKGGNWKRNTPASLSLRIVNPKDYNKWVSILQDNTKDEIAKQSASLMTGKTLAKLGAIATHQEQKKQFPDGIPDFAQGSAPVYENEVKTEIEQQSQFMKYGGYKYQGGGVVYTSPSGITFTKTQLEELRNSYIQKNNLSEFNKFYPNTDKALYTQAPQTYPLLTPKGFTTQPLAEDNDTVEDIRGADGNRVIQWGDGQIRINYPTGNYENRYPDGTKQIDYTNGRRFVTHPDGTISRGNSNDWNNTSEYVNSTEPVNNTSQDLSFLNAGFGYPQINNNIPSVVPSQNRTTPSPTESRYSTTAPTESRYSTTVPTPFTPTIDREALKKVHVPGVPDLKKQAFPDFNTKKLEEPTYDVRRKWQNIPLSPLQQANLAFMGIRALSQRPEYPLRINERFTDFNPELINVDPTLNAIQTEVATGISGSSSINPILAQANNQMLTGRGIEASTQAIGQVNNQNAQIRNQAAQYNVAGRDRVYNTNQGHDFDYQNQIDQANLNTQKDRYDAENAGVNYLNTALEGNQKLEQFLNSQRTYGKSKNLLTDPRTGEQYYEAQTPFVADTTGWSPRVGYNTNMDFDPRNIAVGRNNIDSTEELLKSYAEAKAYDPTLQFKDFLKLKAYQDLTVMDAYPQTKKFGGRIKKTRY